MELSMVPADFQNRGSSRPQSNAEISPVLLHEISFVLKALLSRNFLPVRYVSDSQQ